MTWYEEVSWLHTINNFILIIQLQIKTRIKLKLTIFLFRLWGRFPIFWAEWELLFYSVAGSASIWSTLVSNLTFFFHLLLERDVSQKDNKFLAQQIKIEEISIKSKNCFGLRINFGRHWFQIFLFYFYTLHALVTQKLVTKRKNGITWG